MKTNATAITYVIRFKNSFYWQRTYYFARVDYFFTAVSQFTEHPTDHVDAAYSDFGCRFGMNHCSGSSALHRNSDGVYIDYVEPKITSVSHIDTFGVFDNYYVPPMLLCDNEEIDELVGDNLEEIVTLALEAVNAGCRDKTYSIRFHNGYRVYLSRYLYAKCYGHLSAQEAVNLIFGIAQETLTEGGVAL